MHVSEDPSPIPGAVGIELAPGVYVSPSALRWQFARSSGPGGQNVNKVNTKAELWVAIDAITGLNDRGKARLEQLAGRRLTAGREIHVSSDAERTQEANRAAVRERLRELLVRATHEPKRRRKTKPGKAARERRLQSKKRRSETKARRRGTGG